MKTSFKIRQEFLDFFRSKGHKIVPSAPVIPYDDPTLLFTNAGMNQFKDVFLGTGTREYKRCANTQKCIRVSGKHNDLEEVGHDGYHHTFFEMLGNWSFGDYYKKEAIAWAWELLTGIWKIPGHKLWATVFENDDEAFELWKSETDINPSHVLKFGEKDNFWEMGDTGPCGPCSEIHIDLTQDGCEAKDVNSGNPDVMEFWNLVFIQYNRDENGKLDELPSKNVDTGMGFERLVRILQGKKSNYETDVFLPLINELINITGKDYMGDRYTSAMNVIADHVRALTFAIGDGAIPSNEGRGYVLRRILRRAARYGRNLNVHKPFMFNLVDVLVKTMGQVFPEIIEKHGFIKEVIQSEEESFNETLDRGLVYFNEEIENMETKGEKIFSGEVAFKLHDTYGFPIDLTQLMARERGFEVDVEKFEELMKEQKDRARNAREKSEILSDIKIKIGSNFEYDPYNISASGVRTKVEHFETIGGQNIAVLKHNPFYSESGGQVSDTGKIKTDDGIEARVIDSKKEYVILENTKSALRSGIEVIAEVDFSRRQSIQRNHSATHLVHEALRQVLGPHVRQMGSYLDDKLLRFDFPHFHKLKPEEIRAIEEIVNEKIKESIEVYDEKMPIDKAEKVPNVKRFFGEKYGDEVRLVYIDPKFSIEFCGGTHVKDTSDIGLFKIIKEESISSGTRRILAVSGEGIINYLNERISDTEKIISGLPDKYGGSLKPAVENLKNSLAGLDFRDAGTLLKLFEYQDATVSSLEELREKYLEEKKQAGKTLAKQKVNEASVLLDKYISEGIKLNGLNIVTAKFDVEGMDELKEIGDSLRQKIGSGVGLIYSLSEGKVNIVTVVSDNLIKEKGLNAGKIANDIAKILGGGGGGRPHLATAGGKDISKLGNAISEIRNIVQNYLSKNK